MGYLYDIFAATAGTDGELAALDGDLVQMSYTELLRRADTIGEELMRAGVVPGLRVGVADTLGADLYAAVLGVSAVGCSIVPYIADGSPGEGRRLERLGVGAMINGFGGVRDVTRRAGVGAECSRNWSECYVLSTSGSTSAPKDIAISDRNLESYAGYLSAVGRVQQGDRISQNFQPHFDVFFEVLVMAALGHATIVVPDGRENLLVQRFCTRWGITLWSSVPSQIVMAHRLRQLTPGSLPHVRIAIFGGEALSAFSLSLWWQAAPSSTVVNSYGPSEVTIAMAEKVLRPGTVLDSREVPFGAVLPHLESRLIEPQGASGDLELCVRGPQVFAGYLDPRHNSGRYYTGDVGGFRLRTDGPPSPSDWYRTGDIVDDTPGGLVFKGRIDHEAKVRGKRVDLAEVEALLRSYDGVLDARAMVLNGTVHAVVETMTPDAPEDFDLSVLREYARPHVIVKVGALPRLANGKTDLRATTELLLRRR